MDAAQGDLQFLGFIGMLKESSKIIAKAWKIFTQITLALILPLAFFYLAHFLISQDLFFKIIDHEDDLEYTHPMDTQEYKKISALVSTEKVEFLVSRLLYFIFVLVLSLLSTSAVVYTIASIYTARDVCFKKVMSVVPKVWKRLMRTFLWSFIIAFFYNIVIGVSFLWTINLMDHRPAYQNATMVVFVAIYVMGLVYISLLWQLASVVSVLEDLQGIKAMVKSKNLIKGKMAISGAVFLLLGICFLGIQLLFETMVVVNLERNLGLRIGIAVFCLVFLVKLFLFGLVVQTVMYFVCKSYHHESIDKASLAHHLQDYLGEYFPLNSKEISLEQI